MPANQQIDPDAKVKSLKKICEDSKEMVLAEIRQLAKELPRELLERQYMKKDEQNVIQIQWIINRGQAGFNLYGIDNRDSRNLHPELHTAIKQYRALDRLSELLTEKEVKVPSHQKLERYKKELDSTIGGQDTKKLKEVLNDSTLGKGILKRFVEFFKALKESDFKYSKFKDSFWQSSKNQMLQQVQLKDEPEVKHTKGKRLG